MTGATPGPRGRGRPRKFGEILPLITPELAQSLQAVGQQRVRLDFSTDVPRDQRWRWIGERTITRATLNWLHDKRLITWADTPIDHDSTLHKVTLTRAGAQVLAGREPDWEDRT